MAKTSFNLSPAKIKVIGLGGGGCNAVTYMVQEQILGVQFIAANTDAQALAVAEAPTRIQLGERITRGLGAGGNNVFGQKAAEESRDEIKEALAGADMVFITAGMGGGTGTGSAPIAAEVAKQNGALTIAVVTKPFGFEGTHRSRVAEEGIAQLLGKVDTLIIIPNDRLLGMCDRKIGVDSAFRMADDVLKHGVQAISEVITVPGIINLDFADVRAVMKDAGPAWMSIGKGTGQNRASDAARDALASPLLDVAVTGATGVLFNIIGGNDLSLYEVNQAAEVIKQAVDPDANIIFGVARDANMEREVRITLIATGFAVSNNKPLFSKKDEEIAKTLTKLRESEAELDVPSFMRRPSFSRQRQVIPPTVHHNRTNSPTAAPEN
ncbi:MAG: cell division protein FtsZ [Chloroflexi bacterium]|nr:cell division protein FtsZ [Chloroflexota bacterium]